jgi:hypothetical protein
LLVFEGIDVDQANAHLLAVHKHSDRVAVVYLDHLAGQLGCYGWSGSRYE